MVDQDDFRDTLAEMFDDLDYPVRNMMALVPALPQGPATKFDLGDKKMSAMELSTMLGEHADFPYEEEDEMLDDIIAAMEEEGLF